MWYLTVIFVSASINLDLIKIFPLVLADYENICDTVTLNKLKRQTSIEPTTFDSIMQQSYATQIGSNTNKQHQMFVIACRDFFNKLNTNQKSTFVDAFTKFNKPSIDNMLSAL